MKNMYAAVLGLSTLGAGYYAGSSPPIPITEGKFEELEGDFGIERISLVKMNGKPMVICVQNGQERIFDAAEFNPEVSFNIQCIRVQIRTEGDSILYATEIP